MCNAGAVLAKSKKRGHHVATALAEMEGSFYSAMDLIGFTNVLQNIGHPQCENMQLSTMLSKNKFTTKVSLLSTPLQCILGGPEIQPYTSPSWSVLLLTIIPYISIYLNPCCLSGCWVLCSVVTLLLSEILVH